MIVTGIVMTDIMTLVMTDFTTGVMAGDIMTEASTGLHIGVLLIDPLTIPDLMIVVQMIYGTDAHGVTLVSETGETAVIPMTTNVAGIAVMRAIAGAHLMTTEIIAETAPIMTDAADLLLNQNIVPVDPLIVRSKKFNIACPQ